MVYNFFVLTSGRGARKAVKALAGGGLQAAFFHHGVGAVVVWRDTAIDTIAVEAATGVNNPRVYDSESHRGGDATVNERVDAAASDLTPWGKVTTFRAQRERAGKVARVRYTLK